MDQAVSALMLILAAGVIITGLTTAAAWWMEPGRRLARSLHKLLEGPLDAMAAGPARGQAVGIGFDAQRIAVIRDGRDYGIAYGLEELVGAELIFDGHVVARAFRGEARKPLDRIDPEVGQVMLRLVFDDARDPDVDIELWSARDPHRPGWGAAEATQAARRFFARVEAIVRKA
jgi:hypothetical protein